MVILDTGKPAGPYIATRRRGPLPSFAVIEPGRLGHRADALGMAICPLSSMIWGVLPRARLVHRDREIGACKKYASNVEVSEVPSVGPYSQTGVAMESAVYLGVDIGRSSLYALAVDATGKPIYQTVVANDEPTLGKLVDWAKEHQATVVVDQPGGAAALLLKLCWQSELRIGYVDGLAMARARDFYADESKTDPKDAFVLADVARAHPSRVVWLEPSSEALAHLELWGGKTSRGGDRRCFTRCLTFSGSCSQPCKPLCAHARI